MAAQNMITHKLEIRCRLRCVPVSAGKYWLRTRIETIQRRQSEDRLLIRTSNSRKDRTGLRPSGNVAKMPSVPTDILDQVSR